MKMKEMLNNVGAISKQAIIGGVIGVATLAVGIGLMNNFSSNGSEQGFASNALERSSYSSSYSGAGASAEEIMSVRDYNQGGREGSVSAITGTERLAYNKRQPTGATGQAGVSGEGVAGEVASSEDASQGYGDGEIEGMGTSNQISIDITEDAEAAAKAQAQRNAKIAKGQAFGEQAKASLQTSKMAGSTSGMPTGSSSISYNMGGAGNASFSSKAGAIDSSKVPLAQAQLGNVNLQGAKAGKLDGMGAGGREAEGKKIGRAVSGQNYQSLGDLGRASKYSQSGKQAVSSDTAQGAADAAAAFDGSKQAEVTNLQGENLQKAAASALHGLAGNNGGYNFDFSGLQEELENTEETMKKYEDLQNKIMDCFWAMILAAAIASPLITVAAKSGPWGPLIAGIIAAAATTAIIASQIAAYAYLGQIAKLAKESGITDIKPTAWEWTAPWLIGSLLAGAIAASYAISFKASAIVQKFLLPIIKTVGGGGLGAAISHFFNRIGGKK